jgi:hypothetical protein
MLRRSCRSVADGALLLARGAPTDVRDRLWNGTPLDWATHERRGARSRHRLEISKDGTHDEHPPAGYEMLQVVRQALDVFAALLLKSLDLDDLRD